MATDDVTKDMVVDAAKEARLRFVAAKLMRQFKIGGMAIMLGGNDGDSPPTVLIVGSKGESGHDRSGMVLDDILDLMRVTLRTSLIAAEDGSGTVTVHLGRNLPRVVDESKSNWRRRARKWIADVWR